MINFIHNMHTLHTLYYITKHRINNYLSQSIYSISYEVKGLNNSNILIYLFCEIKIKSKIYNKFEIKSKIMRSNSHDLSQ